VNLTNNYQIKDELHFYGFSLWLEVMKTTKKDQIQANFVSIVPK